MLIDAFLIAKGSLVFCLGCWTILAAYNNIIDSGTNILLINRMMTMEGINRDMDLGLSLRSRAIRNTSFTGFYIKIISTIQAVIGASLIVTGGLLIALGLNETIFPIDIAISLTTLALLGFTLLWMFFLIGGLWFGLVIG